MDSDASPIRPIAAVMAGVLVFLVVSEVLETTLVSAMADAPPTDLASYFGVRNRPPLLGAKVAYNTLAAILAGYVAAKVAGRDEFRYAGAAALIQTAAYAWGFTVGEFASFTPVWMRWVLVLTTAPAMLLGASIRVKAKTAGGAA